MTDKEFLRQRVDAAVAAAAADSGVVAANLIAAEFMGLGVSRATLYRWIKAAVSPATEPEPAAVKMDVPVTPAPAKDAGARVTLDMPVSDQSKALDRTTDYVASLGAVSILTSLQHSLEAAKQVMDFARKPDGSVRNSKLLLAASENLRRGLQTAASIFEGVHNVQRVEAFHRLVLEEIGRESPACRDRILARLDHVAKAGVG